MSKGGGSTRTVTTATEPPEYVKPFLEFGLAEAKRLYSDEPEFFPRSTTVGFAPETEMALQATRARALAGSPLVSSAQQLTRQAMAGGLQSEALPLARRLAGGVNLSEPMSMVRRTARGEFLGGSPGLDAAISRALDPVREQMEAQTARAGRYGSAYGQRGMAEALSRTAADISYADYQRERANQLAAQQNLASLQQAQFGSQLQGLQALGGLSTEDINRRLAAAQAAPAMSALDYTDPQALAAVGAAREAQSQAELAADIQRFQFEQEAPRAELANYLAMVGGGQLGEQTVTPIYRQPALSALSGALGGAQLGGMTGMGAGVGAGLGALAGLLG